MSWYWCRHILWVQPGAGGQEIPDCTGTRGRAPPQDPCQGGGNAATLKHWRTNLIRTPDPNCTSLVSVQQIHFCPHGAVRGAETALHYFCSLFYSSGMFFRWGLSTWKAWGMERKGEAVKKGWCRQQHGHTMILGCCWAAALPDSAWTGFQQWVSVLKSLLPWVKDTAVHHTPPGTETIFVWYWRKAKINVKKIMRQKIVGPRKYLSILRYSFYFWCPKHWWE